MFKEFSNFRQKIVPQSARICAIGGVKSQFGQCPNIHGFFLVGASLNPTKYFVFFVALLFFLATLHFAATVSFSGTTSYTIVEGFVIYGILPKNMTSSFVPFGLFVFWPLLCRKMQSAERMHTNSW